MYTIQHLKNHYVLRSSLAWSNICSGLGRDLDLLIIVEEVGLLFEPFSIPGIASLIIFCILRAFFFGADELFPSIKGLCRG